MDSPRIDLALNEAIRSGAFPGVVLLVARGDDVLYHRAFGLAQRVPREEPMTPNTIFDLASVTKAVVTTTLTMLAYSNGALDIDRRVADFLPEFDGPGKDAVTVRHLLSHSSGLPAWRPYFERLRETSPDEARTALRLAVARERLDAPAGTRELYSDLSMILMAWILERLQGERLDHLAARLVFGPLGLCDTFHSPVSEPLPRRENVFAATEDCPWRKKVLRGRVHDDNCYVMGGVSGHAGLFGIAQDLFVFSRALSTGRVVPADVVHKFWARHSSLPGSSRALGWDTRSEVGSQSGSHLSPGSVGHTGFTGTSLWIDPPREIIVVLLSNRVHPRRDNDLIKVWRPQIHDVVMTSL